MASWVVYGIVLTFLTTPRVWPRWDGTFRGIGGTGSNVNGESADIYPPVIEQLPIENGH